MTTAAEEAAILVREVREGATAERFAEVYHVCAMSLRNPRELGPEVMRQLQAAGLSLPEPQQR